MSKDLETRQTATIKFSTGTISGCAEGDRAKVVPAMDRSLPQNRRETGRPVQHGEATRWKPGQSGNPGGRPKTAPLSHACRELLASPLPNDPKGRTYAEAIAETLADKALKGDIRAAQELADRAEGRARQSIEIENVRLREAFDRMSREELEAYAREGKLPAWFPHEEVNREPVQ